MNILATVGTVPIVPSVAEFICGGITDIRLPDQSIRLTNLGGYEDGSI